MKLDSPVNENYAAIVIKVPELLKLDGADRLPVSFLRDNIGMFLDTNLAFLYADAVRLGPEAPCDEGVCLRIEGLTPTILKAKSPRFLAHETALLDEGVEDLESAVAEV